MILPVELKFYESIKDDLKVVFDVGCRGDNPFHKYGAEAHQFDPLDKGEHLGIFNQVALSDRIGESKFHVAYSSMYERPHLDESEIITVPTDTVDNYCSVNGISHIDLLKIDTEGNDYKVLLGARQMLPKIKWVQFEHWSDELVANVEELLKGWDIKCIGGKPPIGIAKNPSL